MDTIFWILWGGGEDVWRIDLNWSGVVLKSPEKYEFNEEMCDCSRVCFTLSFDFNVSPQTSWERVTWRKELLRMR